MIGEIISNYKIITAIGEGGMGMVYLAEHIHLGRKAAVKSLHKKFLSNHNIKERFKNEAATLSKIHHPNIVELYDYIETNNGFYLIMEYVDGVLLDDFIKKESGPIKEENAVKIITGMLNGFYYAHQKNIVHRDVKPNNIIISRDFSVIKILDFGIAKIINDDSKNLTKDGTQMGTVYYMSPEQVRGQKVDNRSDIYSLGVTFFQMITGMNPYETITTEFEIYTKITQEDLPAANIIYPYVSEKVVAIIKKATQKNAIDRYQNCNQMIADLKIIKPAKIDEEPFISKQEPTPPIYVPEYKQESQTNTALILGLVIGFILIVFVGLYFLNNPIKENKKNQDQKIIPNTSIAPIHSVAVTVEEKTDTSNAIFNNSYGDKFRYTGKIIKDKANGNGRAEYIDKNQNGDTYEGYFKNNLRNGYGVYTYAHNPTYKSVEGTYTDNLLNGIVIVTFNNNKKEKAEYKDDNFVRWFN